MDSNSDQQQAQKESLLPIYKRPKEDHDEPQTKPNDTAVSQEPSATDKLPNNVCFVFI